MNTIANLTQAHQAMVAVLDAKLKNVPEWTAFRAIDLALLELVAQQVPAGGVASDTNRMASLNRKSRKGSEASYVELAMEALKASSVPLPTPKIIEFIGDRRDIPSDPAKARVNISTSLSKDKRFQNVSWHGGRAWWFAKKEVPKESAGMSANS